VFVELGGAIDHSKSTGLVWFKQISSLAVETDVKVQFWLSQVTVIPLVVLSGISKPDRAGRPAHKLVESQVALSKVRESCAPEPPQLARNKLPAKAAHKSPNLI
jgi:hypothetical protein